MCLLIHWAILNTSVTCHEKKVSNWSWRSYLVKITAYISANPKIIQFQIVCQDILLQQQVLIDYSSKDNYRLLSRLISSNKELLTLEILGENWTISVATVLITFSRMWLSHLLNPCDPAHNSSKISCRQPFWPK